MMTNFGNTRSSRRRSKSRINPESPSDYAATPQHPSSDSSPHYMKATSCSEGKRSHFQSSPHSSESSFDSSDQSWSTLSRTSSFKSVKVNSNCQQVIVKPTCCSTLKDSKFPQHVELHPGKSESDRISKVRVCSYHHCSLNRRDNINPSRQVKCVYRRRRPVKSAKNIRLESESSNLDYEGIEYADIVEIVFGETSFPERSYRETMDLMRKYSTQDQDALVTMEREWDESASVSDDVESNDQSVTTSAFYEEEDRDATLLIKPVDTDTTVEEDDNICEEEEEPSKNEPFAIKKSSESEDLVEPFARMELEESLQEKDGKANPTEDVDHNTSSKELHVAQLPKENHRSMWSLIHRHMIPDESTKLDSEVSRGADEENDKDEGNKTCPAESSDSFSSFSESDLMTTNQDADNQETEVRKPLAIKLVREAIERVLLQEVQDQSSDNQSSVTSEVCTDEDFKESDTKNEEHDKASKSDERNITGENTGSPEKQKKGHVTSEAEKKAPKNWSNLKRWILLQRFIKELEKLRKFNPRKPRFLQPEPDPEAEKVNLKHQIEDERKSAEEWMLDFALQKVISKLAPTQKKKVGLLVAAFESVVPPRGSNIQVTSPKLKTRNEDKLQMAYSVRSKYSTHLDKRNSVLYQKLDEVTSTSSDKASVEGKAKQELKENGHTKLEPEAQIDEKEACGDSNDSQKGTSFATSNAGNDSDETQENDMIVHSEDNDGTYRKQANKQKHVSMWQMISQHILSDVVSKVGNELLDGIDDEVNDIKTPAEAYMDNLLQDFSEEKDNISHYRRSFSRNDAVNLIREAVNQILTTPIQDDSSDTLCVTSELS
ncbi:hypothetical protein BC332_26780 [Capsicum chinense]|nr:hypothetical protein BC332_26780 [Capsicum chinense]